MSPRRASQPPPLPPLRARPFTSLLFAPGRARPDARCPPPLPVGAKIPKQNRLRHPQPLPRPFPRFAPVRSRPSASLRDVPGRTARCPLPLPAGAFKHINSYLSTQLLCVRPLPPCKRFFFLCSVIHLVPCLATLRPGPRRAPSQRFSGCAHHKSNS